MWPEEKEAVNEERKKQFDTDKPSAGNLMTDKSLFKKVQSRSNKKL